MNEVDDLLRSLLAPHRPRASTTRLSYREAFRRCLDIDPGEDSGALAHRLGNLGVTVPHGLDRDGLLDLALGAVIAPGFDPDSITFVYDYPASQAALARIKTASPPVAARFEAFSGGLELANGYGELTDADEQRSRFEAERRKRRDAGLPAPPVDEDLLAALSHGLAGLCRGRGGRGPPRGRGRRSGDRRGDHELPPLTRGKPPLPSCTDRARPSRIGTLCRESDR